MIRPTLVTGGNGRLGRALQRVDRGASGLVAWGGYSSRNLAPSVDITDVHAVRAAISVLRPRAIIHLASVVGSACEVDPERAEAVNVTGTANLAEAAAMSGVERIIFTSTAAVYSSAYRRPVSELDAADPTSVYADTKLRAERLLEAVSHDVSIDVMRVFNVYGPEMSDSLIARLATSTSARPARLNGLDGFVRDYVHADDVARALLAAAASMSAGYRVLNVGRGVPRSNRDLLDALPEHLRASVVIDPEVDSYSCAVIAAIQRELAWRPLEPWPPFGE